MLQVMSSMSFQVPSIIRIMLSSISARIFLYARAMLAPIWSQSVGFLLMWFSRLESGLLFLALLDLVF
jgi:hypothetical protein